MRNISFFIIFTIIIFNTSNAQTPEMDEQFVYGIHLSNGKGYTSSFCPQSQNTIYIIANTENVILPRMTIVYYWPLKKKYQAINFIINF